MSTMAFVYPGQGAQRMGMGRALYEAYSEARDAFRLASDVLELDMEAMCFSTGDTVLARTENAQPALFVVSMATHWVWEAKGVRPAAVAGFSLGECVALAASGMLSWEDGLRLVRARAGAMQRAADKKGGAMAAILGLDWARAEELCREAGGFVQPVNDNAPGQVVVAGEPARVDAVRALCHGIQGVRFVPLAVSAAFHTADMAEAAEELRAAMDGMPVHAPRIPVYTNLTGSLLAADTDLSAHMAAQMQNPVRWQGCVRAMLAAGADTFAEVGEGKTLSGFLRRIDRNAAAVTLGDLPA